MAKASKKFQFLSILHKEKITCQGFFSNFCFENAWELGASKKLQDLMDKSLADQVGMVSSISCHLLRYLLSLHEFSTKFSQIFVPSNHITGAGRFWKPKGPTFLKDPHLGQTRPKWFSRTWQGGDRTEVPRKIVAFWSQKWFRLFPAGIFFQLPF